MSDESRRMLLLVEDNPDDEELIRRVIRKAALATEIVVVRDGSEAIDYLGRSDALPALVLLDLELPTMGGHEVLRRIRAAARTKLLPVVILTGSKAQRDVQRSYELGANSYVFKSIDDQQFRRTVEQLGLYWLFVNETVQQ